MLSIDPQYGAENSIRRIDLAHLLSGGGLFVVAYDNGTVVEIDTG